MRYRTCYGCRYEDCEILAGWKQKLKGSGATSISFKCARRYSELQPGRNVLVVMRVGSDGEDEVHARFNGVVVGKNRKGRLIVAVDKTGPEVLSLSEVLNDVEPDELFRPNQIAVRWPNEVELLDGTTGVCKRCGWPNGVEREPVKNGSTYCCSLCSPCGGPCGECYEEPDPCPF